VIIGRCPKMPFLQHSRSHRPRRWGKHDEDGGQTLVWP
jgi:hypothetical protein